MLAAAEALRGNEEVVADVTRLLEPKPTNEIEELIKIKVSLFYFM